MRDLAGILGGAQLAQDLAQARARGNLQRTRQLIPAPQRRRWPIRTPAQRVNEHRAGEAHVRVDRLGGAISASGKTIGHRKQRHVDLDRRGALQVVEDRASLERLRTVHEEPEPQMVAHERSNVCAQALARTQTLQQRSAQAPPPARHGRRT